MDRVGSASRFRDAAGPWSAKREQINVGIRWMRVRILIRWDPHLDNLARSSFYRRGEHRPVQHARVELAVLSERVDPVREVSEEFRVEPTAGKPRRQRSWVDGSHEGLDPRRQHLFGQGPGVQPPQREVRE